MVGRPVSVQRGLTATLPCWLHPSRSAEDMEVLWHHGSDQYDTPVMHFTLKKFQLESQKALYAGRVDFGLKDASSGGLKTGDVSLKLLNVSIEDAGNYTCYVSSSTDYDSSSVSLHVTGGWNTGGINPQFLSEDLLHRTIFVPLQKRETPPFCLLCGRMTTW